MNATAEDRTGRKGKASVLMTLCDNVQVWEECAFFVSDTEIKYRIDSLDRVRRKNETWRKSLTLENGLLSKKRKNHDHVTEFIMGLTAKDSPQCSRLPPLCLSLSLSLLRVLWASRHGRRYHLQPADYSLIHPPRALWLTKVVPLLCAPQQEGPGQCLDCCREWQMAVDSGKAPTLYREWAKPGQGQCQGQMDQCANMQNLVQICFISCFCLSFFIFWNPQWTRPTGQFILRGNMQQFYWVYWVTRLN